MTNSKLQQETKGYNNKHQSHNKSEGFRENLLM